jgi:hypothetical protein
MCAEENKKNMTSMYTNTHLTAKKKREKKRWHAQYDDHVNKNNNIKKRTNGFSNTIGIR